MGLGSLMSVSAVIPTYYRPQELTELLDSLLDQTVKPMEVIIVDDTPTAVIRHLCEDCEITFNKAEIALSYVKNPKERSTAIARNVGARMAKGDILLFLDSDVILHTDYIQLLMENFQKCPEALAVAGWIIPQPKREDVRYYSLQTLKKLFSLFHDSIDSCKFPEYPIALTKTIDCQWVNVSNIAVKRDLFNELKFDENLKGYAFMEDVLFSGSIYKKYPGKLLMTPDAKCIHAGSKEGRMEKSKLRNYKFRNRKYVLTRLFGIKGLLTFGWQNFGLLAVRVIGKVTKNSDITDQFL
jgi:GT2 family glycosyltransferase